jgi:hypothetical protein
MLIAILRSVGLLRKAWRLDACRERPSAPIPEKVATGRYEDGRGKDSGDQMETGKCPAKNNVKNEVDSTKGVFDLWRDPNKKG